MGEDRPGLINALSRTIFDCGCSLQDSYVTVFGQECVAMLLVHGNWNTLAKLETQLQHAEEELGVSLIVRRTGPHKVSADAMPYNVEVIAIEQPGIVYQLSGFFTSRNINIEELSTRSYPAPHTGSPMFSLNFTIGIPASFHVALLREEFLDFCDELNLDAVMEPAKP
ncbi:glycine cleavage system transcriptional repressor [Plasticicumulans acidivorans]|uniref:Glycine cleavage system transcriptional repressor n=2 Tax=Plasticicumulans acidivorans TaxID=886464 RepID=A0A317MQU0_9GAMM|nr:glycine cleavage system transcriptional repressor [Plasticicumulans acidivorans]